MFRKKLPCAVLGFMILVFHIQDTLAQTDEPTEVPKLKEVVVTAEKREENIREVPATIHHYPPNMIVPYCPSHTLLR